MTTIDQLNARGQGTLPGLIGIEFISIEPGKLTSRLTKMETIIFACPTMTFPV